MKKLILIAGLFGLLVACGEKEVVQPKEEPKEETKEEAPVKEETPAEEPKEEAPAPEEPKVEAPAIEEPKIEIPPPTTENSINPQVALTILQDAYEGIAVVEYREELKAFLILPTDPNFALEMSKILSGELPKDDWNYLVDSLAALSSELGPGYKVFLINPANTNNYIVMTENGVVLYDALNEEAVNKDKAL